MARDAIRVVAAVVAELDPESSEEQKRLSCSEL
jgi:hypothetical protein